MPVVTTFTTHITTLPEWEQQIIKHYTFHGKTFQNIIEMLQNKECYVVSDGSSKDKKGMFTWIMSTPMIAKEKTNIPLITCPGQVTNSDPSSYRSEAFGFLSFLTLIYRILQFYNIKNFPKIKYFTDNEGLVKRILDMLHKKHYKQFTPTFAITSEYDAIIAIFNTYNLIIDGEYLTIKIKFGD